MTSKNIYFATGWMKKKRDGEDFISATAKNKNAPNLKLFIEDANTGEKLEVEYFNVFFNANKKKDSHPDVNFVYQLKDQ